MHWKAINNFKNNIYTRNSVFFLKYKINYPFLTFKKKKKQYYNFARLQDCQKVLNKCTSVTLKLSVYRFADINFELVNVTFFLHRTKILVISFDIETFLPQSLLYIFHLVYTYCRNTNQNNRRRLLLIYIF